MHKLSDRMTFSILTTVLTFVYTIYLHLSLDFLGQYWYMITAPLVTFVSSYFLGMPLIKGRFWMINILPVSAALTILSHCLNVLMLCLYLVLTGFFCSPGKDENGIIGCIILTIYGSIMILISGAWLSLFNGGLISFIIFLFSGTLSMLMHFNFKEKNLPEETQASNDRNNRQIKNTTDNST